MTTSAAPMPIHFDASGLVPAVIQDADRDDVLMVGFMNEEALTATRTTGRVHFWSRSRDKLWRKGETSGHEQIVESIVVNCELNSLLIRVHQIGAVCHDGYDTCYYRELQPDNQLAVTRHRAFDPATVYGPGGQPDLAALTRALVESYGLLRDHDLSDLSETSRRLRATSDTVTVRIGEELHELAGVLDGTHHHGSFRDDVQLETSQVIYWIVLACLRRGIEWKDLRPDRALITTDPGLRQKTLTALFYADSAIWAQPPSDVHTFAAQSHATLALVAQAAAVADVALSDAIAEDLQSLRSKPYLQPFLKTPNVGAVGVSSAGNTTERAPVCP